jgi:putative transposase
MTKRAKPKQATQGRFIPNGGSAKSGLNKSILESVWGKTKTFTQYKARRQGKLVIEVPPFHSSQECALCGYIHQDNRHQSQFVCLRCGHHDHADFNAAKVIKKRGIKMLLNGEIKERKRVGLKVKVGTVVAEPIADMQSTLGEIKVNRESGNTTPFWSLTSEPPPTSPLGL